MSEEKLSGKYKGDASQQTPLASQPISYFKNSFQQQQLHGEREAMVKLIVGFTGYGKSYGIKKEIKGYITNNPFTRWIGRPAFLYDTNLEADYAAAFPKTVTPAQALEICNSRGNVDCYRILPVTREGRLMDKQQKRELCISLTNSLHHCLTCLEDIDNYFSGVKPREMESLFVSYRHLPLDVMITHQALGKITPEEFSASSIICLRKTRPVWLIEDRIDNEELFTIAQLMIDEQCQLADKKFQLGEINKEQHKIYSSFFLDIHYRREKIIGAYSKECFIRNCKKYINMNPRQLADFMKMNSDAKGNSIYQRSQAMDKYIKDVLWRYFAGAE